MRQPTEREARLMEMWSESQSEMVRAWDEIVPVWRERDRVRGKWWRPFYRERVWAQWRRLFAKYTFAHDKHRAFEKIIIGYGLMPPMADVPWLDTSTMKPVEGPPWIDRLGES